MKRMTLWSVAAFFCTALLATNALAQATDYKSIPEEKRFGGTLNLFTSQNLGSVDPITTQTNVVQVVAFNLFGQLVRYKTGTWEVVADLADSWTVSSDGLVYTFKMRPNLKFHDGSPIALSDVVFSIKRVTGGTSVWKDQFAGIKSVTSDDAAKTVSITLGIADPYLLSKLAGVGGSAIVPQAAVEKYGDKFATTVESTIASGPFRLVEKSETRLVWERFKDFPAPVYVDRVTMRVIPDTKTQQLEFEAGNIDWISSIQDADQAKRFRDNPKYARHYKEFLAPARNWFGFNVTMKPFDDIRVRQAMAMAIDPETMAMIGGLSAPSNMIIHPDLAGFKKVPRTYPQDVAKAKALLAEAGYPKGFSTDFYIYNNDRYIAQAEIMQQALADIGIQIRMRTSEFGPYMSEVRKKRYAFHFNLANILYPDPAVLLYGSFHSKGAFNSGYSNAEVDSLLEKAMAEPDAAKRADLTAQADEIVRKDAGVIYVWDRTAAHVFSTRLHGVEDLTPIYPRVRMNEIWIDPASR